MGALQLVTILVPVILFAAGGAVGLVKLLFTQTVNELQREIKLVRLELDDKEARLRKLEGSVATCVTRDDLADMRKNIEDRIDRLTERLTELLTPPVRAARGRR